MWKLKGYAVDSFDQTQVVYNLWANTKNDLPTTMTNIGYGTALGLGSYAETIDDSKKWRWNGTAWIEQKSGQEIEISADDIVYDNTESGMTATNVQDAIDELKDTDDMQDRALAELYETKLTADDVWGYGQLIPDSSDLNDYTTGGKYYGGNTAGNTVLNLPVANGSFTFTLEVRQATPSMTYQYLRVCRLADDPYIYIRRKYNSWGTWYRFTGEAVVSTQSVNSLSTLNLSRNDLNESLDTNIESLDSIPEKKESELDV